MKIVKKLFAIALCVALALMLAVPAFADDDSSTTTDDGSSSYTITISNAVEGVTYTAYKLFDVTNSGKNYSYYTIDSDLKLLLESVGLTFDESSYGGQYIVKQITENGEVFFVGEDDAEGQQTTITGSELAEKLNALDSDKLTPYQVAQNTADTTTVNFAGLEKGYYFVNSDLGALSALVTVTGDTSINAKNTAPSITKQVKGPNDTGYADSTTVDVIDTVEYQLTVTVGAGVNADYEITDVLPEGFDYVDESGDTNSITVTISDNRSTGTEETYTWEDNDYDVSKITTTDNGDKTVTITMRYAEGTRLAALAEGETVTITYSATVTDASSVNITSATVTYDDDNPIVSYNNVGNVNTATLTYNGYTYSDTATVYTYEIGGEGGAFTKVDGTDNDNSSPLSGVKFVLQQNDTAGKYAVVDTNGYLTGWSDTVESDAGTTTTITTDQDGHISIKGLDEGTYILTEIETLDGYNLLSDTITVVVAKSGITYQWTSSSDAAAGNTITVENNTGSELPSTGGMGTAIFYTLGGVLVVGAGILLVTKRRMKDER